MITLVEANLARSGALDAATRPLPGLVRSINSLSRALMVPAALACVVLMLHVVVDVAGRTLFNEPLKGTLEITSNWWMVSIVFLGFGYTQLRREHVRATVVTELLPQSWERVAEIAAVVLLGAFGAAMCVYGWHAAVASYSIRESSSVVGLPIWPVTFLVPVGCLCLVLQCVASVYETWTRRGHETGGDEVL